MQSVVKNMQAILEKSLRGELNDSEYRQLEDWLNQSEDNRALFDRLHDETHIKKLLRKMDEVDEARIWNKIEQGASPAPVHRLPVWKRRIAVAASILLVVFAAGGYLFFSNRKKTAVAVNNKPADRPILPGKNGAILTLADGSTMVLDSMGHGIVTTQGTTKVFLMNGQLIYENGAQPATTNTQVLSNTMTTPKGRQYQLVLPDGSKVWLNAASSITYPIVFSGKERKVSITGEAYFEVEKDASKPFIVTITTPSHESSEVEVLGTHFNINSYQDDATVKTTLLEGSVAVSRESGAGSKERVIIKPRQQASISYRSPQIMVQTDVDLEEVMAWKNGGFFFHDADIQTMMRQLARWYDIDIKYAGKIPADKFNGQVSRTVDLSNVLKILAFSDVRFRIEGKTLIIEE
jgi:transmembrane sensor